VNDKRYLILGGSGFIGRNICEFLRAKGHDVVGTSFSNSNSDWKLDLTSYIQIESLLKLGSFDYVIMAAAKTYGIDISAKTPEAMVRENIIMNVNTLDACLKAGIKKVLFISSSTVYQDLKYSEVLKEEQLDLNKDPYFLYQGVGWVKRYTEQLCKFYYSRGLKSVVVRPTNIYGKYDSYREGTSHFIPAIVKRALNKEDPFKVWGTGNVQKDYIHVDDFIRDSMDLFEIYNTPDPVNICSGRVYKVKEAVDIILQECKHDVRPHYDITKLDSPALRILSKIKFKSILGLRNYIPLEEGIHDVINWILEDIKDNE